MYTKPITAITEKHNISSQSFADDTQLHNSSPLSQFNDSVENIQDCIQDIKHWMTSNKLQLNDNKTETLLIHSKHRTLSNSTPSSITIGTSQINFSKEARNLRFIFSDTLDVDKHISHLCRSCNNELRKISSIRHLLTYDATKTLICTLVLSKIDYCNALLVNTTSSNINRLQKIQNSAARLIFRSRKFDHVQPLLKQLHWLPIRARIKYKISLLCFKFFTEPNFPLYLAEILNVYAPSRHLRSSNDSRLLKSPDITKTSLGNRSFSVSAPCIWNSLPREIRHSDSLSKFKSSLKTFLFRLSYDL